MSATAAICHRACFACRPRQDGGLGLRFELRPDGSVSCDFHCDAAFQGYPGRLHGGIISLLLDAAMTHCLFQQGRAGVTARMDIKFRRPVEVDAAACVRARITRSSPPIYQLQAEIEQGAVVKATATGLFVHKPELFAQNTIHPEVGSMR